MCGGVGGGGGTREAGGKGLGEGGGEVPGHWHMKPTPCQK